MAPRVLFLGPSWLGDAVMAIPTYRQLRRAWPGAYVAVLGRGPVSDLYQCVPEIDEVVVYRRPTGASRFAAFTGLVRQLRAVQADVAVVLPRSFGSAWTALLAEAPRRVGYASAGRHFLLTDPVAREPQLLRTHRVHYFQHLLTPLGIHPVPEAPSLAVPESARAGAARLLDPVLAQGAPQLIALNPGANYGTAKQWPEERYVELARSLLGASDAALVIVGGPGDHDVCDRIRHAVQSDRIHDLSGRTTVPELAAVLQRCSFVVSNDTGAMHVAAAVGTPIIAIFGPTDPVTTPPYGAGHTLLQHRVECAPCLLRECPIDHRCMTGIDVKAVLAECEKRLAACAA